MKGDPDERAILLGEYIAQHSAMVRAAAAAFGFSKSTVHIKIERFVWWLR